MSRQCTKCGTKLHDKVRFCPICGQPFSAGTAASVLPDSAQPPDRSRTQSIASGLPSDRSQTQPIASGLPSDRSQTQPIASGLPSDRSQTQAIGPNRPNGHFRTQPISRYLRGKFCGHKNRGGNADTEEPAEGTSKFALKFAYIVSLSCLVPAASIVITLAAVVGMVVFWWRPWYTASEDTSAAATPVPASRYQPVGKNADGAAQLHRESARKTSRCLIIYPKQMRRPGTGSQLGALYAFSAYQAGFAQRAQKELREKTMRHQSDFAQWQHSSEYKNLHARTVFYNVRNRDRLAKAYGRRCIIEYGGGKKAVLRLKTIEVPQAEQNRRFKDDCGFSDCGIKIGWAEGAFAETSQTFSGEGVYWEMPRGGGRIAGRERKVKIRISPKGAYWGDRVFDVYVDPAAGGAQ